MLFPSLSWYTLLKLVFDGIDITTNAHSVWRKYSMDTSVETRRPSQQSWKPKEKLHGAKAWGGTGKQSVLISKVEVISEGLGQL